ncbi:hypothetical protein BJ508DRAFT_367299 [Ascobolus immersus RN42]|uniref:Apple domain-containing protein n=1 Tax=Ascobolus immersus RN42 TaxID=1160509 RepID=A0A3N4HDK5_ASCIM|nr:hypothetical protein BJ508DRAFT_367299 [Ascobolus immersus RN42]
MLNSLLPFSLLALISVANAAAVQIESTPATPEIFAEDLPFTRAEVPTFDWDSVTTHNGSTLEARHSQHQHPSRVISDIKYLVRKHHLEDFCYDFLHWSPYATTKTAYRTKTKTNTRHAVLKVTTTILKSKTKSVYLDAPVVTSTITNDATETITTSSVATTETESPTETVTLSVTATETFQPTTTIFAGLIPRLQSLVDKKVPPPATSTIIARHRIRTPHQLRQYADSSIKTACGEIVRKPYKTKYTTKTRTVYTVSTKVRTEVRRVSKTETVTTTLPATAVPVTDKVTVTATTSTTVTVPVTETTTVPVTITETVTATTVTETGSTSTVRTIATACPQAPEYTRVTSWVGAPYFVDQYMLFTGEAITQEECCLMCHYGFPACASWLFWPNKKYGQGVDYCGATIKARRVGGAPQEEISEKCPNGLNDILATENASRPEDYVAGNGPCMGRNTATTPQPE